MMMHDGANESTGQDAHVSCSYLIIGLSGLLIGIKSCS
jgi:hypothetical protein